MSTDMRLRRCRDCGLVSRGWAHKWCPVCTQASYFRRTNDPDWNYKDGIHPDEMGEMIVTEHTTAGNDYDRPEE